VNPVIIGEFIGAFSVSLAIAAVWLIIAKIIPPLRKYPKGVYITAMVLCALIQLVPIGGPGPINISAAITCILLLAWQMKRAQAKLQSASITPSG